ncbi:sensor histidine kinase [Lederbergia sp. NSJ-179]|uniref:sensor histidine kinase n=1 Tax=Lederbergia sp. NSJ-179 TaxID=2931402 RepID=UPI001FD26A45|nr:sensor histidine kinase [Lederbergia sp. NSJ-179]MCJ7842072.1 sensor histidine kinase [Lederbergia sp. NSJ-179]
MKYLGQFYRSFTNKKVKIKLLGIYLLVTVIPTLLIGFYLNYSMRDVVLNNTINEVDANVDKLEMRLNTILDRAISISDQIYISQDLKKVVDQEYENNLEIYNAYAKYPIFDNYLRYYNEIENIRFFMTKDMITNSQFVYADQGTRNQIWYQEAVERQGRISWRYTQDKWTEKYYLTLTRSVYGENHELLGVLAIYISPGNLNDISKNELFDVFVSLDNEKIVHSKDPRYLGKKPAFIQNREISEEKKSIIYDANFNQEKVKVYLRSFKPSKTLENQIQITALIPIEDVIKDSKEVLYKGFLIVLVCLITSITLIVLFIQSFDKRIYQLRDAMNNIAKGRFHIKKQNLGEDEIGGAYRDLEVTADSIKQLINEVYIHKINEEQWKRRQKESEFKMLASQINPHFLYNTLEMIRMKALINKDHEVARIVMLLSQMMRSSLEVSDQPILLESELELVKTYLEIQKMRFGDKIDFDIKIECDIQDYYIFPLLLQPLVENAVIHGIDRETENSHIEIQVLKTTENLVIQVIDNGIGISASKLVLLKKTLNDSDDSVGRHSGIGLNNVNKRIKLYYGDPYGVDIQSEVGSGTVVTLFLPLEDVQKVRSKG